MKNAPGISGLVLDEPLLWEKGKKGRSGMSCHPTAQCTPSHRKDAGNRTLGALGS